MGVIGVLLNVAGSLYLGVAFVIGVVAALDWDSYRKLIGREVEAREAARRFVLAPLWPVIVARKFVEIVKEGVNK